MLNDKNEELGLLFDIQGGEEESETSPHTLVNGIPMLNLAAFKKMGPVSMSQLERLRPMTREEADDFVLATLQGRSYYRDVEEQKAPPLYWVPLSAFIPILPSKTKAEVLNKDSFVG